MSKIISFNPLQDPLPITNTMRCLLKKEINFVWESGKRRHKNNLIYLKSSSMKWEKPLMNQFNRFSSPFSFILQQLSVCCCLAIRLDNRWKRINFAIMVEEWKVSQKQYERRVSLRSFFIYKIDFSPSRNFIISTEMFYWLFLIFLLLFLALSLLKSIKIIWYFLTHDMSNFWHALVVDWWCFKEKLVDNFIIARY